MTTKTIVKPHFARRRNDPGLVFRLAMRQMRGGLRGFYILIGCIALGLFVITGVNALSDSLRAGLEREGRTILGGDIALSRMHARASEEERAILDTSGRVSEIATMRTMARNLDTEDQLLVELKAVDRLYPLVGAVELAGDTALQDTLKRGAAAAVDPILLERLQIKIGDSFTIGDAAVIARAIIEKEPDGLGSRLTYGPRVLISQETLEKTGLIQPGALMRWRYAIALPANGLAADDKVRESTDVLKGELNESGFRILDRSNPSPDVVRTLERLRQFLTLLGLTAMLVGGVGVANAVATFIDRRRNTIATMKSLGATSGRIFMVFLIQVLAMAILGVVLGLLLGATVPLLVTTIFGSALPITAEFALKPGSIVVAVAYGLLVALMFTLWPLGRAERIPVAVLFRDDVTTNRVWPHPRIIALTVGVGIALVVFALLSSQSRLIVLYFVTAVTLVFGVFTALGYGVTWAARKIARPRTVELALALGNLGAPGGLARSVVLSLGAGLSLLVAVALADASFVRELTTRLPASSPDYYVLDIKKNEADRFSSIVSRESPEAEVRRAPMLRGRLVKLKGVPVDKIKAPPSARWVLSGDRGLTYAETIPDGSRLVEGEWWPSGYQGEPLVSFEAEIAKSLNLTIGDAVTVNVLGRDLTARIASLREVDWESLAINFVMVFSPNTLKGAPSNLLATIRLTQSEAGTDQNSRQADLSAEARLMRALSKEFPAQTQIRVRDAIDRFNEVFQKIMIAVRIAGGVTLVAGALVLAGALATAQRRRIREAVILSTLGATRRRIMVTHLLEYLILAAITAAFAVLLGGLAAWAALTFIMDVEFIFSAWAVLQALVLAIGLVLVFGGVGTWQVLQARPVPYLRSD